MSDRQTQPSDHAVLSGLQLPPTCTAEACWTPAEFFVRKKCCLAITVVVCGVHLVEDADWIARSPHGVRCRHCGTTFPGSVTHADLHTTQGIR